jgi:hypothetical protein
VICVSFVLVFPKEQTMKMTPFRALLIAVVVVVVAAVWFSFPQAHATLRAQQAQQGGRTASNSQMWVYRVDPVPVGEEVLNTYAKDLIESIQKGNAARIEQLLNQRAGDGWVLGGVGNSNFYFKRPR